jgi:hypothetical protein
MDLEHRVKTLEHEVKILKNQIQRTLLEIQEQVLTHYYPSLRSEEIVIPESMESPPELPQNGRPPSSSPAEESPAVRQVSLAEIRKDASTPESEDKTPPLPLTEPTGHSDLTNLAYWVGESVAQIGVERTGKLIEIRAKSGQMADNVKDALVQLAALCGDGSGDAPDEAHIEETIGAFLKLHSLLRS